MAFRMCLRFYGNKNRPCILYFQTEVCYILYFGKYKKRNFYNDILPSVPYLYIFAISITRFQTDSGTLFYSMGFEFMGFYLYHSRICTISADSFFSFINYSTFSIVSFSIMTFTYSPGNFAGIPSTVSFFCLELVNSKGDISAFR